MFKLELDNLKVGKYLEHLITEKYPNVRQFCSACLKANGNASPSSEDIGKMQNKISQIIKGHKSIQTYDLPTFCDLLGVSCEQILSAGKCFVPISGHVTNYEIALSKDREKWKKYIEDEDTPFLNPDEYNKTVVDYAIEFRNYEFLKYLMDNKYIWFVDNSKTAYYERAFGFGAGTSIERRRLLFDCLEFKLYKEQDVLRKNVIALALENNDFETLTALRAREVPTLYNWCSAMNVQSLQNRCRDYYSEEVMDEIVKSSDKVLDYFSQDFSISDQLGREHWFMYPYMPQLLERLIRAKSRYSEVLLRRAIAHNKKIYDQLSEMISEAFELSKSHFNQFKAPVENAVKATMDYFQFDSDEGFVSYMFARSRKDLMRFCGNVVCTNAESDDLLISSLIEQLNQSYKSVQNIQPDISNY